MNINIELEKKIVGLVNSFNNKNYDEVIKLSNELYKNYRDIAILPNLIGASYAGKGNHQDAINYYNKAFSLDKNNFEILNNIGKSYLKLSYFNKALSSFEKSILLNQNIPETFLNLGIALYKLNKLQESINAYNQCIELKPTFIQAHYNLGIVYSALGKNQKSINYYNEVLRLKPNHIKAINNLAIKYIELNKYEETIILLSKAIEINSNYALAYSNLGVAYLGLKNFESALISFSKAFSLDKKLISAGIQKFYLKKRICDWTEIDEYKKLLEESISSDQAPPWQCLSMEDNPKNHLIRSSNYSKRFKLIGKNTKNYLNKKLRIGYFAGDFHRHPGMINMSGIFKNHDKSKFEIYGFYYGQIIKDEMHFQIKKNFDKFFYVDQLDDEEIANLAKANKIDIAINRSGHTAKARAGIFGHKAAPIQINYLGYAGTLGQEGIDYIISDKFVIPRGYEKYYSEKIIYLTSCYYPRDNTRVIGKKKFYKTDYGINDDAFVFISFNNTYKISEEEFNIWMKILKKINNSYFLLLTNNEQMKVNIIKEAVKRGISSDRVRFLDYVNLEDHLSRHSIADLFLDTFNYNAHTSCVDSLWAELPVLTKVGKSFSARVCGSILEAFDLPELIAYNNDEYENKAIELALNKSKLEKIKLKIIDKKNNSSLFDIKNYTLKLEEAFEKAHLLRIENKLPDNFEIN